MDRRYSGEREESFRHGLTNLPSGRHTEHMTTTQAPKNFCLGASIEITDLRNGRILFGTVTESSPRFVSMRDSRGTERRFARTDIKAF